MRYDNNINNFREVTMRKELCEQYPSFTDEINNFTEDELIKFINGSEETKNVMLGKTPNHEERYGNAKLQTIFNGENL